MNDRKPHWHIIVNPVAHGGAVGRQWPQIERLLQLLEFDYTVKFTESRGHAVQLVEDAAVRGYRHIMALGGDGTNHEVVNGIMQQKTAASTDFIYALLPIGTGNDWARMYGLSRDPEQRLRYLTQHPQPRYQDIGYVTFYHNNEQDARYFVNVAGMGYDGYICQQIAGRKKPVSSPIQYLALVARYLFSFSPLPARIRTADSAVEDHFYTINIGICKYSGGGMQLVPQAVPDDGYLALTYALRIPKWQVLLQTPRFYSGKILDHPRITGTQAREINVETIGPVPTLLEADGEYLGHTPVHFSIREKALCFV
jgi:diacylglycerol kinase (ATP)